VQRLVRLERCGCQRVDPAAYQLVIGAVVVERDDHLRGISQQDQRHPVLWL
jgi:hypothetical protein